MVSKRPGQQYEETGMLESSGISQRVLSWEEVDRWETGLECTSKVQRKDHEGLRCGATALGTVISEKKHKLLMVSLRDLGNWLDVRQGREKCKEDFLIIMAPLGLSY